MACMCATTGVSRFCVRRLDSTGGRISTCSPATTAQWLLRSEQKQHPCDLPNRSQGTITRDMLRLYTQLEAILDSVPTVTA